MFMKKQKFFLFLGAGGSVEWPQDFTKDQVEMQQ